MGIYTESDIRRFYSYVAIKGPDECWEWTGGGSMGYGQFHFGKDSSQPLMPAHRFAFWIATGVYPGELFVCHSCDNKSCVNPKHLWLGTAKDNMQDAVSKGRMARGERNSSAKLTEDEVREIRSKHKTGKWRQAELAEEYNISRSVISNIVRRRNWTHI